jgi:dipeptidyl aminopeptidase/acylaminoacyl peptidase
MTKRLSWVTCGAVLALACAAAGFAAPPSMREVLTAAYAVRDLGGVALAPDGESVAWEESFHNPRRLLESPRVTAVYAQRLGGGRRVRVTAGKSAAYYDEENPVWSPDARQIAFLSDARSRGQMQLFVARADGTYVHELARFSGDVQRLTWSPDGSQLAVLYIPAAHRKAGALAPGARDVGVIGAMVDEQRVAVVGIGGRIRIVSPPDTYVYEYGWSPDGSQIAVTYARGNGDNNWWVARLASIDVANGEMHDLFAPSFQLDDPQWSPDSKHIAVIGGLMSDFGSTGGDLYLVDAATGASRDLTSDSQFSVQSLRWNTPSSLNVVVRAGGAMTMVTLDVASGKQSNPLAPREEQLPSWSTAKRGSVIAAVRTSFDAPPELWAGPPGALRQITSSNAGTRRLYGKAVSLQWRSDDYNVQGWLIYPLEFDPRRSYPMVTIVHGGPSAQALPGFGNRNISALSSEGYFVFMPNPRGSFGQGEAFTRANVRDFGYGDWRDDLAGVDAALRAAPIDPNRLGLMGWSYGGYMAMWAETQTTRFRALVAGAGIVDWQSYYGQNKIDQWMLPFFGASVYDDPAVYAKSSPITFIEHSKTPVLILQGERDEEVPAPQAFEFWHAMQTLGVPTKLVVYADEGHGPQKLVNQIDILDQTVGWFNRYL